MGENIRRHRKEQGMTLAELGEQVGVTASHISQIERDLIEPSLGLLRRIAQVLGVSIHELFSEPSEQGALLLPGGEAPVVGFPELNGPCRFLSAGSMGDMVLGRLIKVFEVTLEPDLWLSAATLESVTDVCCYVIVGELDFYVGEDPVRLGPGDSMFIPRHTEYRVLNSGTVAARMIWAYGLSGPAL